MDRGAWWAIVREVAKTPYKACTANHEAKLLETIAHFVLQNISFHVSFHLSSLRLNSAAKF